MGVVWGVPRSTVLRSTMMWGRRLRELCSCIEVNGAVVDSHKGGVKSMAMKVVCVVGCSGEKF